MRIINSFQIVIGDNYLYIYLCEIPLYLLAHLNAKSILFLCKLSENNTFYVSLSGNTPIYVCSRKGHFVAPKVVYFLKFIEKGPVASAFFLAIGPNLSICLCFFIEQ